MFTAQVPKIEGEQLTEEVLKWFNYPEPERACIADLMFCHGTQIMDNSKICHCRLFHDHGKPNFVQPFFPVKEATCTMLHTYLDNNVIS